MFELVGIEVNGSIQLYDMFLIVSETERHWIGSRRTKEQCEHAMDRRSMDPLASARERGRAHPDADLWERICEIIRRDGDPANPDGSVGGGANEIISLRRKHLRREALDELTAETERMGLYNMKQEHP